MHTYGLGKCINHFLTDPRSELDLNCQAKLVPLPWAAPGAFWHMRRRQIACRPITTIWTVGPLGMGSAVGFLWFSTRLRAGYSVVSYGFLWFSNPFFHLFPFFG